MYLQVSNFKKLRENNYSLVVLKLRDCEEVENEQKNLVVCGNIYWKTNSISLKLLLLVLSITFGEVS